MEVDFCPSLLPWGLWGPVSRGFPDPCKPLILDQSLPRVCQAAGPGFGFPYLDADPGGFVAVKSPPLLLFLQRLPQQAQDLKTVLFRAAPDLSRLH